MSQPIPPTQMTTINDPQQQPTAQKTQECPACDGCGKVANTDEREPWTAWLNLPFGSAAAVVLGIVRPVTCERCTGTGEVPIP